MDKHQYIHCPHCNGLIERVKEEECYSPFEPSYSCHIVRTPRPFKCRECKKEYVMEFTTEGILKVTLKEV